MWTRLCKGESLAVRHRRGTTAGTGQREQWGIPPYQSLQGIELGTLQVRVHLLNEQREQELQKEVVKAALSVPHCPWPCRAASSASARRAELERDVQQAAPSQGVTLHVPSPRDRQDTRATSRLLVPVVPFPQSCSGSCRTRNCSLCSGMVLTSLRSHLPQQTGAWRPAQPGG